MLNDLAAEPTQAHNTAEACKFNVLPYSNLF